MNLSTFNGNNILMVGLSHHKMPEFIQKRGKEWVLYGELNDYPQYLIDLYNRNAIHGAITSAKATYLGGLGFEVAEGIEETLAATYKQKLESIRANEMLRKTSVDFEVFNGFSLEVISGKGGIKVADLAHIDLSKLRKNIDGTMFAYTQNWVKNGQPNSKPENEEDFETYPAFDVDNLKPKSIIYYKHHRVGAGGIADLYPIPDYVHAVADIEIDINVTNFHYNNTANGFSAGKMVIFKNGVPTPDEQKILERKLKNKFTKTDNAGEVVMVWINPTDGVPEILNLQPNDLDKQFKELAERLQQNIFSGHKVTSSSLFGVAKAGALGSRNEMQDAWELFNKTYVMPRQTEIMEVFEKIFMLMGIPKGAIYIKPLKPLDTQVDLTTILTQNELRELAGYKPLELKQPAPTPQPTQMKKVEMDEHKVLEFFKTNGVLKKDYEVVESKSVNFKTNEDCLRFELEMMEQHFAETDTKEKKPTTITPKNIKIQILYSYEVRSDVPEAISGSRPFCEQMMGFDKYFSRNDIERLSTEQGGDVWLYRGGFYHNPNTGETTPYCRHEWVAHKVYKRS